MKKKTLIIVIAVLVVAAAVLAVVVSQNTPKKDPCEVIISYKGEQTKTDLNSLKLVQVKGTITMASGKTKDIDSKGIEIKDLLAGKEYTEVAVNAEDNYSAVLVKEDIDKAGNAYIILGEENKPRLVVMSDTNAKRDVKNVMILELK